MKMAYIRKDSLRILWFAALTLVFSFSKQSFADLFTYDPPGNLTAVGGINATAPSITTQPQSALLYSNNSVSFSVAASGAGVSYQWLSNGVPILGATGDTLLLPN